MSDSKDPFSDSPYVPPTRRGTPAADSGSPTPEAPAPDGVGGHDRDTGVSDRTEPEQSPAREGADHEPTVPVEREPDPYTHRYGDAADPAGPTGSERGDDREHTSVLPLGAAGAAGAGHAGPGDSGEPPRRRRRGRRLVGALAFLVLALGAGIGGAWLYDESRGGDSTVLSSLDSEASTESAPAGQIERVAQKLLPSVTQVNVAGGGAAGSGTGIIISSDGDIMTNNHVIEAAADGGTITVAFSDGTTATAEIVGRDPKTDLAVIKAEGKEGLTPATLGSSANLKVGQEVVAIGSPFGLESTVTSGIVSALNRPVASSDGSGGESTVFPAVQTDAAINPGNSGGPLIDLQGRVVGINSAIRTNGSTSADSGSIGLGFAIPVDLAKSVGAQLVRGDTVEHAMIGVTVAPAVGSDEITGVGAEVREVTPGSAGAEAGLQEGDVITAVNDNPVGSSNALVATIRGYQPGETVTLTYLRDGETAEVEITLDSDGGSLDS